MKIQTSLAGTFSVSVGAALAEMSKRKAETWYSFEPVRVSSQIPYTMAKFSFFEHISEQT